MHAPTPGETSDGQFAWPPKAVAGQPSGTTSAQPALAAAAATKTQSLGTHGGGSWWSTLWSQFEREWLGLRVEGIAERLAQAGWQADEASVYCPRCGNSTGPFEADAVSGCSHCKAIKWPWERLVRLGRYEGLLRRLILETKFTAWRRVGRDLGVRLGASLGHELEDAGVRGRTVWLVPVAMAWPRRLARGIDHATVLARGVREGLEQTGNTNIVVLIQALGRRHRPTQVGTPASERWPNVRDSMWVRPRVMPGLSKADVVVLIDDIKTTGATLRAASRAIEVGIEAGLSGADGSTDGGTDARVARPRIWACVAGVREGQERREG